MTDPTDPTEMTNVMTKEAVYQMAYDMEATLRRRFGLDVPSTEAKALRDLVDQRDDAVSYYQLCHQSRVKAEVARDAANEQIAVLGDIIHERGNRIAILNRQVKAAQKLATLCAGFNPEPFSEIGKALSAFHAAMENNS